jgi:hypothetical protein
MCLQSAAPGTSGARLETVANPCITRPANPEEPCLPALAKPQSERVESRRATQAIRIEQLFNSLKLLDNPFWGMV